MAVTDVANCLFSRILNYWFSY